MPTEVGSSKREGVVKARDKVTVHCIKRHELWAVAKFRRKLGRCRIWTETKHAQLFSEIGVTAGDTIGHIVRGSGEGNDESSDAQ